MQVFKLVRNGWPDSVIGFDSLPEDMLRGVLRGPIAGWQRHWFEFMNVDPKDKGAHPFYLLDYTTRNADKQKWQEISGFVKRNAIPGTRLMDKIEAMAVPVAPDSYSDLNVEPEDMPMIKLAPAELPEAVEKPRRGRRPKDEAALAA